jgi:hypothetical protein
MMPLSEAQKKERRQRYYQDCLEYINKYRGGDVLYHVTPKENAASLLENGFDPKRIGTQGGCQGGAGMSFAWCAGDAWDWGRKIYGWGNEHLLAVVKATLPGVKLATHQQADESAEAATAWALKQGYFLQEKDENEWPLPSPKIEALFADISGLAKEFVSTGWTITGLYLQTIGYDGYFIGIDEIVIVNYNILQASAFSLVEG